MSTRRTFTIARALPADAPEMAEFGYEMRNESRYRNVDWSWEKAYAITDKCCNDPDAVGFVARGANRQLVGMFMGYVCEFYFGRDKMAADLLLYVDPDYRGTSMAPRLIRRYEDWARQKGAVEINLGVSTDVEAERTVELYRRLGYQGTTFSLRKDLRHV